MATAAILAPSLSSHLQSLLPRDGSRDSLIHSVIPALLQSIADIAQALRSAHHVSAAGTSNTFGDDQLNVDVTAESLIREAIARCPSIVTASSEEDPVERLIQHTVPRTTLSASSTSEQYTIAFDPLDGSSIIPANWTVGTIISLWDGRSALRRDPATDQVAAILGVYGPRTTAIIAVRDPTLPTASTAGGGYGGYCFEVALDTSSHSSLPSPHSPCLSTSRRGPDSDEADKLDGPCEGQHPRRQRDCPWVLTSPDHPRLALPPTSRYFAPANLRAAADDPAYMALVTRYVAAQYTLRYSGGLVPDVVHMLVTGRRRAIPQKDPGAGAGDAAGDQDGRDDLVLPGTGGVYLSPVLTGSRSGQAQKGTGVGGAKLRRLYELCPVALVAECAGGLAVDPVDGSRVLGREVADCAERGGIVCGSAREVDDAMKCLLLPVGAGMSSH